MKKVLQKQVVQNITPLNKRKYIKKSVEAITESKPEVIVSPDVITVIENENDNNVQNKNHVVYYYYSILFYILLFVLYFFRTFVFHILEF